MKVDMLPAAQAAGGVTAAVAVFMSPLPVWAALLIVALAVVAVATWLERLRDEPEPSDDGEVS
jgi:hypothetical protein